MNILREVKVKNAPYAITTSKQVGYKPIRIDNKVLYRKREDGTIVCLKDVCPHRGARLSQGWTTNKDDIVCPYHGWEFDDEGYLTNMPSHKSSVPDCNVKKYEVTEDGGYVWLNYVDDFVDTHCPELKDPDGGKVQGSRLVKGNWIDWISNSWDVSHINFVHDFGDENDAIVHDLRINYSPKEPNIVNATCKVNPKPVNFTTNHMQKKKSKVISKIIIPNTTRIDVLMKKPYRFITFTTVMPIDKYSTVLTWSFLWNFDNKFLTDKNYFIKQQFEKEMYKTVYEDEQIIQNIDENIPYTSVPADALQLKCLNVLNSFVSESHDEFDSNVSLLS